MLKMLDRLEERGLNRGIVQGRAEGRAEGRIDMNLLYAQLFKQGRAADVQRAVEDPEFLKLLMAEFGIKDEAENDGAQA